MVLSALLERFVTGKKKPGEGYDSTSG